VVKAQQATALTLTGTFKQQQQQQQQQQPGSLAVC
jgi:hypothetical protein